MSRITEKGATGPLALFNTTTDLSLGNMTGAKFDSSDGREFVIVQNGGTALVSGVLVQSPAKIGTTTGHQNLATSTAAIGATSVSVTLGGTAATANQYAGGYIIFNAGTGLGQTLKIASHPAQSSTSGSLTLTLEDPIQVATLSSDTKSCLVLNPYGSTGGATAATSGVVVMPTTNTGAPIGVTLYPIAATTTSGGVNNLGTPTYGLIQTKGLVSCLNDANTAIGLDLMPSSNTAGAVMTYVAATNTRVGTATQAGVTTESRLITIQL